MWEARNQPTLNFFKREPLLGEDGLGLFLKMVWDGWTYNPESRIPSEERGRTFLVLRAREKNTDLYSRLETNSFVWKARNQLTCVGSQKPADLCGRPETSQLVLEARNQLTCVCQIPTDLCGKPETSQLVLEARNQLTCVCQKPTDLCGRPGLCIIIIQEF